MTEFPHSFLRLSLFRAKIRVFLEQYTDIPHRFHCPLTARKADEQEMKQTKSAWCKNATNKCDRSAISASKCEDAQIGDLQETGKPSS